MDGQHHGVVGHKILPQRCKNGARPKAMESCVIQPMSSGWNIEVIRFIFVCMMVQFSFSLSPTISHAFWRIGMRVAVPRGGPLLLMCNNASSILSDSLGFIVLTRFKALAPLIVKLSLSAIWTDQYSDMCIHQSLDQQYVSLSLQGNVIRQQQRAGAAPRGDSCPLLAVLVL